ncbi:hypothetical protein HanRHA438_Chr10g0431091 [Helianthus annuus]|nr:hypothetical protein HanRHA438_Chr10g0431091 [Helianthus annuus]
MTGDGSFILSTRVLVEVADGVERMWWWSYMSGGTVRVSVEENWVKPDQMNEKLIQESFDFCQR